jgi:hypothetical protein
MTTIARHIGLLVPLGIWIATTQMGQILPDADCQGARLWTPVLSMGAAAVAFACILLSWLGTAGVKGRMGAFLASLYLLIGLTLTFAISLQAVASVLVSPCLR